MPKKLVKSSLLIIALTLFSLSSCSGKSRLSSAVFFQHTSPEIKAWLQQPSLSFMESYVWFDDTLDKSVIFGIDQELLEGKTAPLYVSGGDWMGLVGVQRDGKVWLAAGNDATMSGKTSKDRNWAFLKLNQPLSSRTWYRLHTVVDFATRHYVSFTVEGPNINQTLDLRQFKLDYPNMLPFDGRAMTNFVWAIGGTVLGGIENSDAKVYFDDVRTGIFDANSKEITLHTESFENTSLPFPEQPINYMDIIMTNVIPLKIYQDKTWYLERGESLARPLSVGFARTGNKVAMVDVTLRSISYTDWLKEN